jgi:hypothetical protein
MVVNPLPDAGVITGVDKVCVGTTVTMSDTVMGGTWFVSSLRLEVDSTGVVTGKHASSSYGCDSLYPDKVYYTVSNGCGSDTAFKIITVNPQPDAFFYVQENSLGPYLCAGYWSYPLGAYSCDSIHSAFGKIAISGHSISKGSPGGDSLYCITTNYCGTASYGTWMYFGGPPEPISILADFNELCMGMSDTLRSSVGNIVFWQSLHHKVSLKEDVTHFSDRIVTAIDTGKDVIYLERKGECGSRYDDITITVKAGPDPAVISPTGCKGGSDTLIDGTANGIWISSDSNIASIDKNAVTYIDTGMATIRYTLANGCAASGKVQVTDCTVLPLVELFPNPVKDELMIHLMGGSYNHCTITNSIGQLVIKAPILYEYISINTRGLAPGIYYVRLTGSHGTYNSKLLKQ